MGTAHPPQNKQDQYLNSQPLQGDEHVDVHSLIKENVRLRGLVIQLSELVLRNVMDQKKWKESHEESCGEKEAKR